MEEGVLSLEEHSKFFDHLVELIPPKIYLAQGQRTPVSKYLHGSTAKAKAKLEAKEHLKKARHAKLDPASFKTTLDFQKEEQQKEATKSESHSKLPSEERAATYEQLRERLQQRLQSLRAKRKADVSAAAASEARDWQLKKRARPSNNSNGKVSGPSANGAKAVEGRKSATAAANSVTESKVELKEDLQYGRLSTGGSKKNKTRKRPRTERLLAEAAALQEKLKAAEQAGDKKKVAAHTWSSAAERAAGVKVLDDPRRLKKTLQRQQKSREKSAAQWDERKKREKTSIAVKQQKRKDHLRERVEGATKARIAKREKKLLRPGFEGRAKDVINKQEE